MSIFDTFEDVKIRLSVTSASKCVSLGHLKVRTIVKMLKNQNFTKMKKLLLAVGVQAQIGRYVDWANYDLIDEIDKGKDPRTVRTSPCSK